MPLFGRASDVAALGALLADPRQRVVTLSGPGGVGKTRLALEVLRTLGGTFAASMVIDFGSVDDLSDVPTVLSGALASLEQVDPDHSSRRLLILETFEHVIESASLVSDLVATDARLTVVVTSREALGIRAEIVVAVDPLPVPELDAAADHDLGAQPAVALFEERARARAPRFVLTAQVAPAVAELCRELDGLPLAIELAAAQTLVLSPSAMLRRLASQAPLIATPHRDGPPRHQTLEDNVAWSYGLLTPDQAEVFRWTGVFSDSFTLDALEYVVGPRADLDVIGQLVGLVAKNLVRVEDGLAGESRFVLLRTVRRYAASALRQQGGWGDGCRRHAEFYLDFAERVEPALRGPAPAAALDEVASEYSNVRSVLEWSLAADRPDLGLRLAAALYRYWQARGPVAEARAWLTEALGRADDLVPPHVRAAALNAAGVLAALQSDHQQAEELFADSLRVWHSLHQAIREGSVLLNLGLVAHATQRPEQAEDFFARAYRLFASENDRSGQARALASRARLVRELGDLPTARQLAEDSLALFRSVGDQWGEAHQLVNVGHLHLAVADRAGAITAFRQGLIAWHALGNIVELAECFEGLATARADRQPRQAARLLGVADALRTASGAAVAAVEQERYRAALAKVRDHLREDTFAAAWAQGHTLSLADAIALASADLDVTGVRESVLSPRELEVARLIGRGYSNSGIAEALVLSVKTVETHIKNIFRKLRLRRRAEVAAWAAREGVI